MKRIFRRELWAKDLIENGFQKLLDFDSSRAPNSWTFECDGKEVVNNRIPVQDMSFLTYEIENEWTEVVE